MTDPKCECDETYCEPCLEKEMAYYYREYKAGLLDPIPSHIDAWNEKQALRR
jgi:hypothetical protein